MQEVRSMEQRVTDIVEEFFKNIDSKEPFETELMEFKLKFRAKLLEIITAFSTQPEIANRTFDYALDAIEQVIKKAVENVNLESEESLYRTIKTLEGINEVLKEFLSGDKLNDKKKLSSITGYIGNAVERLRHEYRQRYGGFFNTLKRLIGLGRSV